MFAFGNNKHFYSHEWKYCTNASWIIDDIRKLGFKSFAKEATKPNKLDLYLHSKHLDIFLFATQRRDSRVTVLTE